MEILRSTYLTLNDYNRISERDAWFDILKDLFDGKQNDYLQKNVMTIAGTAGRADAGLAYENPEEWVCKSLDLLAETLSDAGDTGRFAPACVEYTVYGVHFIDKILGCDVFFKDGQWYSKRLETPVGTLKAPDLNNNETWKLAKRAALAFMKADVKLPLFGTPTLSSALNTVVNIYGSDALLAMAGNPEPSKRDLKIINDTIMSLHTWYMRNIPARQLQPVVSWSRTQPPGYGQLCGCTTQLVSASTYNAFIRPLDELLLGLYPGGGMVHLCGVHTQHIEAMSEMGCLKAVQLNDRAALDLELYYKGLRKDQIIYLIPFENMGVDKALQITNGERLVICDAIKAPERKKYGR